MAKSPKLNDLQLILLGAALQCDGGSLLPFPDSVARDTARITKAVASLLRHKLIEEVVVTIQVPAWREGDDQRLGLVITAAGRNLLGAGEPEEGDGPKAGDVAAPPPVHTKVGLVLNLLHRPEGATLAELAAATGWLPHTTRAALTGLRKKGHAIGKARRDEATCYRIGTEG